jgi:hypothetical protein
MDISPGGLKLNTAHPLSPGEVLYLDLALPGLRLARVAHVEQTEEEGFAVGCTLVPELSDDEFQGLRRHSLEHIVAWLRRRRRPLSGPRG